jgi:hypothetical protein
MQIGSKEDETSNEELLGKLNDVEIKADEIYIKV